MPKKLILKNPASDELSAQLAKTAQYLLAKNLDGLVRHSPMGKKFKLLYDLIKSKL